MFRDIALINTLSAQFAASSPSLAFPFGFPRLTFFFGGGDFLGGCDKLRLIAGAGIPEAGAF